MNPEVMQKIMDLEKQLEEARNCLVEVVNLMQPDPCTDGWGIFADIPQATVDRWTSAAGLNSGSQK